jgi:uncharacterized Zn-finger protein
LDLTEKLSQLRKERNDLNSKATKFEQEIKILKEKKFESYGDNNSTVIFELTENECENLSFQQNITADESCFSETSNLTTETSVVNEEITESSTKIACQECTKTYNTLENLRRHQRKVHSERENDQEYLCSECNKKFKHKSDLTQHLRIHQEKIDCSLCSANFTRKDNLLKHMRNKHNK